MSRIFAVLATAFIFVFCSQKVTAQINLHTEDLPRFYQAFDSVLTTSDSLKQIEIIQTLYVDKASAGLKEFMILRGGNAVEWRKFMLNEKQLLIEKRPWILSARTQQAIIEKKLRRFKELYPNFRDGDVYFCVGINNSGGTIYDNTVYIGTEVVARNSDHWAVSMVLHEFAHTQQWRQRNVSRLKWMQQNVTLNKSDTTQAMEYMRTHSQLLGRCLEEGMADFVAELVHGESAAKNQFGHTTFGLKNEQAVWNAFKKEMFLPFDHNMGWLYGSTGREIKGEKVRDLGYFIGHQICKSYYNKSKNKKQALKEMLELDFTDENAKKFLIASGYLTKKDLEIMK
jgi:uncharacterized protein YjaZ